MVRCYSIIAFILFARLGFAQFSIAASSTNYTQNFNTLTSGVWSDNVTVTGWYVKTDATASITTYGANTGSTTTAGLYAFGVAGTNPLSDRALGFIASNAFFGTAGSQKGYLGWRLVNSTGNSITSLTVTWTGEEWRREANTSAQSLILEYQTGTTVTNLTAGTWTSAGSTFTSPVTGSTASALDGNATANRTAGITVTINFATPVANGEEIMLRWSDLNDSGNDHAMAIDDITVNASTSAPCSVPSIQASALSVTSVSCNSVTIDWIRGNGSSVLITGIAGASATTAPSAGTAYTDNTLFTAGSSVGGGYAIYNGTGTSVTVTGLSGNTQYTFAAYEYNSTGTCYLTPPASITFTTSACSGTQCPYITSSLINSCEGVCGEGDNEIIFMNSGSYSFAATPANVAISYGNSSPASTNYTNSFSTNAGTISTLNTAAGCGTLFVDASSGTTIPANSSIMLVKNTLCPNAYDWTALCGSGPVYVLFSSDADWAAGGNFVNGGTNPTVRYFRSDFSAVNASCITDYNYNAALLPGGNGSFITYGTAGGSPSGYTNTGCALSVIVLPVIIESFECGKEGHSVKLAWKTSEEHNVSYYRIERSVDGINFNELAVIHSNAGRNSGYYCYDEQPYKGFCYYRIASVDNDGYIQYHKIVGFNYQEQSYSDYSVLYGDGNEVTIDFADKSLYTRLTLYNLAGQNIFEQETSNGNIHIQGRNFTVGMYMLKISRGNKIYNDKIIIH